MNNKAIIYDYLQQNKYMALAISSKEGKPEVATVAYILDSDDLLINTYTRYRKYQNLLNNSQVACVVTTKHDKTLQLDGRAIQLEGDDAECAKQKMLKVELDFANYFEDKNTRFFRITPIWIRLRDYTKEPLQEIEYTI